MEDVPQTLAVLGAKDLDLWHVPLLGPAGSMVIADR